MHLPEELHPAPERSDPAAPIHFVDCFCGLGGAAQGARDAGLDVALGVDSNEKRLDVFSLNFPEAEGVCGQLAVPTSVFTDDMLRAKLPKGDFHIHFSPPCQELSVARGAKDDEAARDAQAVVAWCVNFASTCGALSWSLEEVNSADVFDALEALQKVDDNGHLNFLVRDVSFEHLGVPQSRRRFLAGSPWLIRRIAELERAPSFLSIADAFAATTRKDAGGAPLKIGGSHFPGFLSSPDRELPMAPGEGVGGFLAALELGSRCPRAVAMTQGFEAPHYCLLCVEGGAEGARGAGGVVEPARSWRAARAWFLAHHCDRIDLNT